MWHMFDGLHSEFIYVSHIGPHIGQEQLIDLNFAKPPSTRKSVLFRVFKVPRIYYRQYFINMLYSEQKKAFVI